MLKLVRALFTAPAFENAEEKTRTAGLLNIILPASLIIALSLSILTGLLGTPDPRNLAIGAGAVLVVGALWYFMRRGYVAHTSIILLIAMWFIVSMLIYLAGTIRDPIASLFLIHILLAGLLIGGRAVMTVIAVDSITLLGLMSLEQARQLNQVSLYTSWPEWITFVAVFSLTAVILHLTSSSIRASLEQARRTAQSLTRSNRELQLIRTSLEQRVAERTEQLRVSAEVSRAITSILDPNLLIEQVVQLITNRFNFYYAAIFLIDDARQNAVLRAATGEAGRQLIERGHKLELSSPSMVGLAISTSRARIALETDTETMRFANPLLTETKSEIALPLSVGSQSFGALDVQSTLVGVFDEGTATLLQGLADQVAIALNNAQQFQISQNDARQTRAIFEASRLSGSISEDLSAATTNLFRSIAEQVGFDGWSAVSFDQEQAAYTVLTSQDTIIQQETFISREVIPINRQPQSLLAQAIVSRRPIIIKDPQTDPRLIVLPAVVRQSMGGLICMPAILGDQVVGAIS
ncbi:MAG TPA: GAF domain-containing protein, partial [Anaerolineae bacterium]|nr:GAF domain-containing protein [Anaerolineae bacterium]